MKHLILLISAGVWLGAWNAGAEVFILAKAENMMKETSFLVLTGKQYQDMNTRMRLENSKLTQVHLVLEKEWKADESREKSRYPGRRLAARKVTRLKQFPNEEKAAAERDKLEEKEDARTERAELRAKEKAKKNKNKKGSESKARAQAELEEVHIMVQKKLEELMAKVEGIDQLENIEF